MKHIHLVDPYGSRAMERLLQPLEKLAPMYSLTRGTAPDPDADLNFHMPWHTMTGFDNSLSRSKNVIAYTHINPPDKLGLALACEKADVITAMSWTGRRELLELGVAPEKIRVNYCAGNQFAFRQKTIAVIGYAQPNGRKREHLLLDLAWSYDMTPFQILFTGTGWEQVIDPLQRLGVTCKLAHAETDEQMAQVYSMADLLLVTAHVEGGPLPLLEAMCAGVPVLAPRIGYANDLLADDELYDSLDDLKNKLDAFIDGATLNYQLAHAWTWNDYIAEYAFIFGELLGEDSDPFKRGASRYAQLETLIKAHRPRSLVEIGTWNGNRAWQMLQAAGTYSQMNRINYTGFDLFDMQTGESFRRELSKYAAPLRVVRKRIAATGANVHFIAGDTRDTISQLPFADFYFVDGGHSEETIENDGRAVLDKLGRNCVAVFDDYYHGVHPSGLGCNTFIDALDREIYEVSFLPELTPTEDGRMVGMVKVRLKNAAVYIHGRAETYAGSVARDDRITDYSLPILQRDHVAKTTSTPN